MPLPEASVNAHTSPGPSEMVMQIIFVGQALEVVALVLQGISQLQDSGPAVPATP